MQNQRYSSRQFLPKMNVYSELKQTHLDSKQNLAKIRDIETKLNLVNTLILKDSLQQKYQNLFQENLCLNQLIKDYEQCLEVVMLKFRQQSTKLLDLELKHSSEIRENIIRIEKEQLELEKENLELKLSLSKVCGILREGLRAEDTVLEESVQELLVENDAFRTLLEL